MSDDLPFVLDGSNLSVDALAVMATSSVRKIAVSEEGLAVMAKARKVVDQAIENRTPVYGVTTGLGAQATKALGEEDLAAFSYQTIRGRAHAIGDFLPRSVVRAAMIIRLNTLLIGGAGASPSVAEFLVECLNRDLIPAVGGQGSIGASDLTLNATLALALIGEGFMLGPDGKPLNSLKALNQAGLEPLSLGPRDGLAICNNTSFSAALSVQALAQARSAFQRAEIAAAMTMTGFKANLSPFDARILEISPKPGQVEAALRILALLKGGQITKSGQSRRLQDPLSIRNIPQIHGTVLAAMEEANRALMPELNGISDNPAVLVEEGQVLSSGAYFTPQLTNALDSLSRSFVHLSMAQLARMSKLLNPAFSDLPLFLSAPGTASNGFAPVLKVAESLVGDLAQRAQPTPLWPSISANGTEDVLANTPTAAKALLSVAELSRKLSAIETLMALRAIDLSDTRQKMGQTLHAISDRLRTFVLDDGSDRPLTKDIEAIVDADLINLIDSHRKEELDGEH